MTEAKPPGPFGRREFVAWLIVIGTIPALGWSAWRRFRPNQPLLDGRPTSRRRVPPRPAAVTKTSLASGLYQNVRTSICHYVDSKGEIRADGIRQASLKPVSALDLHPLREVQQPRREPSESAAVSPQMRPLAAPRGPRVCLAQSSRAFEQLALARIQAGDFEGACEVLLVGIEHDVVRVRRSSEKPSFRTYDLLALIAVRRNLERYVRAAKEIIEKQPDAFQAYFKGRLAAWNSPTSGFTKRSRNPQRTWAGLPM